MDITTIAKSAVLAKHPEAVEVRHPNGTYEIAASVFWDFFEEPWLGKTLGTGTNAQKAWVTAAGR